MKDFIPWLISAGSLLVAILGYCHTKNKDDGSLKEAVLKANIKLDSVCATQGEIRTDIKSMVVRVSEVERDIAVLQRDLKTAYVRIEALERTKQ